MKLNKELDLISNLQQAHNFSVNEIVDNYEKEHGTVGTEKLTEEWFAIGQRAYLDLSDSIVRAIDTMKMITGIGIQEENSAEVVADILEKHMNDHIEFSNLYGDKLGGWDKMDDLSLEEKNNHVEIMYSDLMEVIGDTIEEAQDIDTEYQITLYDTKEDLMGGVK